MKDRQGENDVKSLVGRIEKGGMGERITKTKPLRTTKKARQLKDAPKEQGNILEERFDDTLIYQPKTKQNRIIYENFLGRIYSIVQDQPQDTLKSIADEVLAILKKEEVSQDQKETEINFILREKIHHETFLDLSNIVRSITDYQINQEEQPLREEMIIQDEDEDDDGSEGKFEEEEQLLEEDDNDLKLQTIHKKQQSNEFNEDKNNPKFDYNTVDAHWLHSKLSQYYDPQTAQNLQKEILPILNFKSKLEVQNSLLSILNYQKYQLIRLLLENRKAIYYCVKYWQTQNQKERELIAQQMRVNDIIIGKRVKKGEMAKKTSKAQSQQKAHQELDIEVPIARDEQINRLNKKIIDLNIHDESARISNKQQYKFKLPEGASKIECPGYQEIQIPSKIKKHDEHLIEIEQLPSWIQPVFSGIKRFNPIQSKVFQHTLHTDKNMLVCAPTSAGKTNIALLAIMRTIQQHRSNEGYIDTSKFKIVYIAPMKALVSEITGNLSNRLKQLNINVKELTGDMHLTKGQIEETQVIVATPEKWDIITRKAGDRLFTQQVRLLIIDEIHLLADQRGPVLQSIIARTIRQIQSTQQHVRIVGLSATLPNYQDVGSLLKIKAKSGGLFYFDQSYRPIPLDQFYVGVTEKKGVRKMMMINEILYEKVMERLPNHQIIIFVHSRRDTVKTAKSIRETAFAKDHLSKIIKPQSQSKKILQAIVQKETINSSDLKELLTEGIGIHHAGLSRADRDLVEQLFADRHLNILVSTATLAWGVNLPARTVIIKGTQVYSPEEGRWIQLSLQDVMQMLGRAGRPRYDEKGEGIIITGYEQVRYYLGLLNMQVPLESQLMKTLPDQLNAEIVLGTISNVKDGVHWLAYTYLFIRMLKNPKYYSISPEQFEEDADLLKRRVNLIHTAASILERNGLVNYDRKNGTITSTFLGKVASYYYIKYPSMAIYNTNLKSSSTLIDILKIFSMSLEFKYITVREEEKNQLQKLMESVPVPIKGSVEDATSKISVLLQSHISKLHLDGYALNVDKIYITQSASRIMRALFEICVKRGWGQVAQRCLDLAKMIDKSMWSCMNPLRQFKQIPQYVLSRLEKKQQFSWQSFYQMTPQQIGDLTKFPKLGKILHKFVHHVPRLQLDAYAQPITRSCLKVDLTVKNDFKWQDEFNGKQQPFWLFVLDCNDDNILYSYYFVLTKSTPTFHLQFIVPLFQILHPLYFIKVISDRWICSDSILPLSFRSMVLPSKFPSPNEILDLQPYPAANLGNLARQLKLNYLNQIQTQTYSAFINSYQNVFVGSAEGSGKFTMALFVVTKCIQNGQKSVILINNKSQLNNKVSYLARVFSKNKVGRTFEDLNRDSVVLAMNDIIVTTPQSWDILSRRWKARNGFSDIGVFIIDNLHMVGENNSTMEVVVSRMRYISSQLGNKPIRIIGLSTSVADYKEMAEWIGAPPQNTFNFHPSVRQNSVEIVFNSYDQHIRQSRIHNMQRNLMQNIKHYNRNTIVFVSDKKQAKLTALDFVSLLSTDVHPKRMRKIMDDQMKLFSKKLSDQYLTHILQFGIGYLYEGMNEVEREIVFQLFQIDGISILIITHGLKWELECKSFMVSILDCSYFDGKTQQWINYSIPQVIQMMSLANTSEKDKHKGKEYQSSKFMIYCHWADKNYYKKFLFEPYPVESSLNINLHNHLNSGIVSKSIHNKEDCIDWLTWTFMYRRLTHNPNYYNMHQVSQAGISTYLSELIENSIDYLQAIKCLEVENEMDLQASNLGIICSYYYIRVETLAKFIQKINQNSKLKNLIEIISEAEQLDSVAYQPNEYQIIGQLLVSINETAINKAHALLLLYFSRVPLSHQLLYQIKTILPICIKLTHALIDVISSLQYLKPLILAMQMCQMITQGMWVSDSPLLQIMDKNTALQLETNYNIKDVSDFIDMDNDVRMQVLKNKDIEKISLACNRYPLISLSFQLADVDQQTVNIKVKLNREEQLENDAVISTYYPPGEKEEIWWVVIGDKKTSRVLTTKRTMVKQMGEVTLSFDRINGTNKYLLYALCDSYVGCDQSEELSLE